MAPKFVSGAALGACLFLAIPANADNLAFTTQVEPSYRGEPGARFDGFDVFTSPAFLPNFADLPGSCAGTLVTQTDPAAILTSAGNIYSFATATSFDILFPAGEVLAEVSVQIRALATPIDASSAVLAGSDALGNAVSLPPSSVVTLDAGLGGELQFLWDAALLAGVELDGAQITLSASGPSCSMDVILVDYRVDRDALEVDADVVAVGAGGVQSLDLDGGADRAGDLYFVLGSATGTVSTLALDGVAVPLTVDAYTTLSVTSANSGSFGSTFGSLDECGRGAATVTVPAGSSASLAGAVLNHAFVSIDTDTFAVDFSSNAAPLNLQS